MKTTDLITLLPLVNNPWTLIAFLAVLVRLYTIRKRGG
jgi:hypothetical protein